MTATSFGCAQWYCFGRDIRSSLPAGAEESDTVSPQLASCRLLDSHFVRHPTHVPPYRLCSNSAAGCLPYDIKSGYTSAHIREEITHHHQKHRHPNIPRDHGAFLLRSDFQQSHNHGHNQRTLPHTMYPQVPTTKFHIPITPTPAPYAFRTGVPSGLENGSCSSVESRNLETFPFPLSEIFDRKAFSNSHQKQEKERSR